MNRIQRLDHLLANQIAAGEVVERPASIIKELVENSLDAGATQIDIDIEQGGMRLIRVRDNGAGIHADDLPLALSRHATSKIFQVNDLTHIATFGFRGEALASIGAVSRLTLTSAQAHQSAWEIVIEGEATLKKARPAAHPCGTTVEVRDLFFNTPARRKFLKSEKTEFERIDELIKRLALSSLTTQFNLKHGARLIRHYPAACASAPELASQANVRERLRALCGPGMAEQALYIESQGAGMELRGWIAPNLTRSQPDMQYFYVNERIVRDKRLAHALNQAHKDILYRDRHPVYILFLTLHPSQVDVNVHPTKQEVRFRDGQLVHEFILRSIQEALAKEPAHSCMTAPADSILADNRPVPRSIPLQLHQKAVKVQEQLSFYRDLHQEIPPPLEGIKNAREPSLPSMEQPKTAEIYVKSVIVDPTPHESPRLDPGSKRAGTTPSHDNECLSSETATNTTPAPFSGFGHALAQLHDIYILAENTQGLVIIDMHAAHERVLYEKMKTTWLTEAPASQTLLIPITLSVSTREAEQAERENDYFSRFGFDVQRIGQETLVIRAVPELLAQGPVEQLVRDILADMVSQGSSTRTQEQLHHLLGTLACRYAIRARKKLSLPEMNALLREMENTHHAAYCNHGRPAYFSFSMHELDHLFLRGR